VSCARITEGRTNNTTATKCSVQIWEVSRHWIHVEVIILGLVANQACLHVLEILSDFKLELDGKRPHNPRLDMEPSDFQLEISGLEEEPRDTNRNKNISSQREFLFTALYRLKGVLAIFHDLSMSFHATHSYFPISVKFVKVVAGRHFLFFSMAHCQDGSVLTVFIFLFIRAEFATIRSTAEKMICRNKLLRWAALTVNIQQPSRELTSRRLSRRQLPSRKLLK